MRVKHHAIRRYKKRIGDRTASKERIIRKINREIEKNTIKITYNERTKRHKIYTSQFIAVCAKNIIVTILPPAEWTKTG